MAFVGAPVAAGMALTAGETVRIIYGPQWGPVAPLLVWFSVGRDLSTDLQPLTGLAFHRKGTRQAVSLVDQSVNATVLSAAFAIGVNFGAWASLKHTESQMSRVLLVRCWLSRTTPPVFQFRP